ncbi:MAG: hypothetical protein AAGJ40_23060 [Planctomycetota bacterium]
MRFHTVVSAVALLGAVICQFAWGTEPTPSPDSTGSRRAGQWVPVDELEVPSSESIETSDVARVVPASLETSTAFPEAEPFEAIEPCGFSTCAGLPGNRVMNSACVAGLVDCGGGCGAQAGGMRLRSFDLAYATSDLLFLGRDVDNFRLVGTDGGTNFFEESLSHGFEPGFRLTLGLRLWGNGFVEARHAQTGGWDASGNFQPLPGDPGAIAAQGTFEADYHSTEINLVAEEPVNNEYQLLLGLRFIEHGDSFAATLNDSQAPPNVESYAGSADNSMFGVHAGFRTGCFYRRSIWSISLLGGVMNNQISQSGPRFGTALVLDGVADPTFSVDDDEVSIFADIEGSIAYPICPSTFVRVGYQGVFLDNAVTVTRQEGSPDDPDAIEFHGGFVGLEFFR